MCPLSAALVLRPPMLLLLLLLQFPATWSHVLERAATKSYKYEHGIKPP